jgi:hypothetical protein
MLRALGLRPSDYLRPRRPKLATQPSRCCGRRLRGRALNLSMRMAEVLEYDFGGDRLDAVSSWGISRQCRFLRHQSKSLR